jgi:hypothetical protein
MKTAEEITAGVFVNYAFTNTERMAVMKIINEARKEVIEECAKDAFDSVIKGYDSPDAVKQSILNLINELK